MKYLLLVLSLLPISLLFFAAYDAGVHKSNRANQKHIDKMNLLLTQYEAEIAHCQGYLLKFTHSK